MRDITSMVSVVASWNQAVTVRLVTCCDRHRSGTGNANDTAACRGRCSPKVRLVILWQDFEALDSGLGDLRVSSGVSLGAGEVCSSASLGCGERRVGCVALRGLWEAAAGAVGEGSSLGIPGLGIQGISTFRQSSCIRGGSLHKPGQSTFSSSREY